MGWFDSFKSWKKEKCEYYKDKDIYPDAEKGFFAFLTPSNHVKVLESARSENLLVPFSFSSDRRNYKTELPYEIEEYDTIIVGEES